MRRLLLLGLDDAKRKRQTRELRGVKREKGLRTSRAMLRPNTSSSSSAVRFLSLATLTAGLSGAGQSKQDKVHPGQPETELTFSVRRVEAQLADKFGEARVLAASRLEVHAQPTCLALGFGQDAVALLEYTVAFALLVGEIRADLLEFSLLAGEVALDTSDSRLELSHGSERRPSLFSLLRKLGFFRRECFGESIALALRDVEASKSVIQLFSSI